MAATLTSRQFCGTCNDYYEVAVPAGSDAGQVLEALNGAGDAHLASHAGDPVHIRRQAAFKRGNAPKYGKSEDGSQTLCGAPAGTDIGWGDFRFPGMLATVTCEDCKRRRAAGEGAR
jgi:hypothetical protein